MSNFFQTSLKKEKLNRLEGNKRTKNNEHKNDRNGTNDTLNKKKNAKKFMISPVKESSKENDEYKNNYNQTMKKNITNSQYNNDNKNNFSKNQLEHSNILTNIVMSPLKKGDEKVFNKDENNYDTFSFKYNNIHASPLYTNTETIKKSISSTLCYEPLYNTNENENEIENTNDTISKCVMENKIQNINLSRIRAGSGREAGLKETDPSQEQSSRIQDINQLLIDRSYDNNSSDHIFSSSESMLDDPKQNGQGTQNGQGISNYFNDLNVSNNKISDKNYTTINKLNFTSLSCEPVLTYIQKDKFKLYNYNIMIDTNTQTLINNVCDVPCFYCRRKFDYIPLGIPIKYYPSLYILIDNSLQTSKYSFNYKENIIRLNKNEKERLLNILKNNPNIIYENKYENKEQRREHKIVTKNFFETDGNFCSFNCIISFIEENGNNPLYQNSYNYLYLMYKQIFGEYPSQPFIRSPSWKLRKEYGGPLNDDDYSKYIQSTPIVESKQIKTINNNIKPELIFEVLI